MSSVWKANMARHMPKYSMAVVMPDNTGRDKRASSATLACTLRKESHPWTTEFHG